MSTNLPIPDVLTVYGASWCGDCANARRLLDRAAVSYRYIDLGQDPTAQALLDAAGYRAIPVILAPDGRVLVDPPLVELAGLAATAAA